jgi:hypothetical protein
MRTRKVASIAAALPSAPAKLLLLDLQPTIANALLVNSNMILLPYVSTLEESVSSQLLIGRPGLTE